VPIRTCQDHDRGLGEGWSGHRLFGGGGRLFAACATALALALAVLTAPLPANAARAGSSATPSAAAQYTARATAAAEAAGALAPPTFSLTGSADPWMLLEDGAQQKLDDVTKEVAKKLRGVVQAMDTNINKTWMPQDVWLIVAWHFAITKGRKWAYKWMAKKFYNSKGVEWEKSFWRWIANPMRVVGALWITTYLFDNGLRLGTALELPNFLPTEIEMIGDFDRGMYAMASGIIAVMSTNHWLPGILKRKFGIKDTSQRLIITRLATFAVTSAAIALTALLFGVGHGVEGVRSRHPHRKARRMDRGILRVYFPARWCFRSCHLSFGP
jgi:hypothetical protein